MSFVLHGIANEYISFVIVIYNASRFHITPGVKSSTATAHQLHSCLTIHLTQVPTLQKLCSITTAQKSEPNRNEMVCIEQGGTLLTTHKKRLLPIFACSLCHYWPLFSGMPLRIPWRSKFYRKFILATWEFLNFKMCQNSNFYVYSTILATKNVKSKTSSRKYLPPLGYTMS